MKRSALLLLLGAVVIATGFVTGSFFTRFARQMMAPQQIRQGDFRFVADAVGSVVVLLSTTTCPWCEKTRAWLDTHKVAYRDCHVDIDPFAKKQLDALGASTVPQLLSATTVVSGFDEEAFAGLVEAAPPLATPAKESSCIDANETGVNGSVPGTGLSGVLDGVQ